MTNVIFVPKYGISDPGNYLVHAISGQELGDAKSGRTMGLAEFMDESHIRKSRDRNFLVVFLIFAVAVALRFLLLGDDGVLGFMFFFPGAAIAAITCSGSAILLYLVLATLFCGYSLFLPHEPLLMRELAACLVFVLSCLAIVLVIRRYKNLAAAAAGELRLQLAEKESVLARLQQARDQLSEIDSLFQKTVDHAAVGIAHVAPDGQLLMLNPAFCEILGYASADLRQRNFRDITHPDDLSLDIQLSNELLRGERERYTLEKRYIRSDGEAVWVNLTTSLARDAQGAPSFFIGVVEDIGKRKAIEAALHQSEEKFRNAFENAAIAVAVTTPKGEFVDVNHAYCSLTGYEPDELRRIGFQQLVLPDDSAVNLSMYEAMLDGRIHHFVIENRYLHKSGRPVWVRKSISLVRDESGAPRWVIALVEKIQERKEAERAAQAALEDSHRANEAKLRFLAAASHDLRQPLSALSIYVSSLKEHLAPSGQTLLGNLRACVESLSELLNDLLDLSKLQAGVVTPVLSNFLLDDLLLELQSIHQPEATMKGLGLKFRMSQRVVQTDRLLFRQILSNLIANAIRYSNTGRILVARRCFQGKTWVEVWDTGIGIPEARIADVFDEFVQIDTSRTKGSGLGLAITSRIAVLLGLEIRVKSKLGRGSMFAIEVPGGDAACLVPASCEELGTYRPLNIALIEDNQAVRTALAFGLGAVGHTVAAIASKAEIAHMLDGFLPDIIVSDYRLAEGARGVDVIQEIRERTLSRLPAILITGDTDPRLVKAMADSGIVVLHKPIQLETILAYLEDVSAQSASTPLIDVDQDGSDSLPDDLPGIDMAKAALWVSGKRDLIESLDRMLTVCGDYPEQLRTHVLAANCEALARMTHDLMAAAATIGASALIDAAKALHQEVRSGVASEGRRLAGVEQIKNEFCHLNEARILITSKDDVHPIPPIRQPSTEPEDSSAI